MANPDIPCDLKSSKLDEYVEELKHAMKLPLSYLKMVDYLVNKTTTAALTAIKDQLDDIAEKVAIPEEYMNPAFDMSYAASALQSLRNCANVINDPDVVASMDEAISLLKTGGKAFKDLPHAFKKYIGNALYRGASSTLRGLVQDNVTGKLNQLRRMYSKALKGTGVSDTLNKIDALMNCMAGACDKVDDYFEAIDKHYTDLRIEDNGAVGDIIGLSPNIENEVVPTSASFASEDSDEPTTITAADKKAAVTEVLDALDKITKDIYEGLIFTGATPGDEIDWGGVSSLPGTDPEDPEEPGTPITPKIGEDSVTTGSYKITRLGVWDGSLQTIEILDGTSKIYIGSSGLVGSTGPCAYLFSDGELTPVKSYAYSPGLGATALQVRKINNEIYYGTDHGHFMQTMFPSSYSLCTYYSEPYIMMVVNSYIDYTDHVYDEYYCEYGNIDKGERSSMGVTIISSTTTNIFAFDSSDTIITVNSPITGEPSQYFFIVGRTLGTASKTTSDIGRIKVYRYSEDGTHVTDVEVPGIVTRCQTFNDKLFFGSGCTTAKIGMYTIGTGQWAVEKTFDDMDRFGDFCVYKGDLWASVLKKSDGIELWKRTVHGTWDLMVSKATFNELGTPGVNTDILGRVGLMAYEPIEDKIYLVTNDATGDEYGPSYLFTIETV